MLSGSGFALIIPNPIFNIEQGILNDEVRRLLRNSLFHIRYLNLTGVGTPFNNRV